MDDVTPSVVVILYSNDPALCFHSLIINASSSSSSNVLSNEAGFRRRVHCIYLSINHHACRRMKAFIQSNIQIKNSQWNSVSYSNNCRSNHRDQKMKSIITVEAKLNMKKCSKWNESSSSKKKKKIPWANLSKWLFLYCYWRDVFFPECENSNEKGCGSELTLNHTKKETFLTFHPVHPSSLVVLSSRLSSLSKLLWSLLAIVFLLLSSLVPLFRWTGNGFTS